MRNSVIAMLLTVSAIAICCGKEPILSVDFVILHAADLNHHEVTVKICLIKSVPAPGARIMFGLHAS